VWTDGVADDPTGEPPIVVRLRRREEFRDVTRHGRRWVTPAFVLQAAPRPGDEAGVIGLGFTASRKVGKAVQRNRARRRLREAARQVLPGPARPGVNYVIVARPAALTWPFDRLKQDLEAALIRVHAGRARRGGRSPSSGDSRP
jgi:ribonuclease P protein component